ncbi:MAG: ThiF family adenylyltransferase [Acidimicrobiaceae bacterium]|nr:ThiF family adenylyltransferase [Acidimicrobiaceae bacterium]
MNEQEFHQRWLNRTQRYTGSHELPADLPLHIHVDPEYGATYSGQVAAITAASLFGRMSRCAAANVPSVPMIEPLPWKGTKLDEHVMQTLHGAHKFGKYDQRPARKDDLRIVIGPCGDGLVAHGSGWAAYLGTEPSPLAQKDNPNPYGAAFSVIAAAAQIQAHPDAAAAEPMTLDTFRWRVGTPSPEEPQIEPNFELGNVWSIGLGSVGSCALFFLALITRCFSAVLVDRDNIEVENLTRSALFSWQDAVEELSKVEVASRWLHEVGLEQVEPHLAWLHEIRPRWAGREQGTPDLLISAANEHNVRNLIEEYHPPLQVYATTGRNYQTTLYRHTPLKDPCSRCVPGSETTKTPMPCAIGTPPPGNGTRDEDDVALPFLSYSAGLMTAAEITKLALVDYTETPNRVLYEPQGRILYDAAFAKKPTCPYHNQDAIHEAAIQGSRFASLSTRQ